MAPVAGDNGNELYDRSLLLRLDLNDWKYAKFNPPISIQDPGAGLRIRPLEITDFEKGFINLLSQLTKVGDISEQQFRKTFEALKHCPGTYYVTVIEDLNTSQVIGSATLFVEQKFIHSCAKRGRIEDVVVNNNYRGRQLGKFLIAALTLLSKSVDCYKVTLDCRDDMISFYTSLGFMKEPKNSNFLQIRFESKI